MAVDCPNPPRIACGAPSGHYSVVMRALVILALAAALPTVAPAADDRLLLLEGREGPRPFQQASHLKNRKQWDEAIAALAEAERRHGAHADIHAMRAEISLAQDLPSEAAGWIAAALARDPEHRTAMLLSGRLQLVRGDRRGAMRTLDRLSRACPFGCAQEEELRAWLATPSR